MQIFKPGHFIYKFINQKNKKIFMNVKVITLTQNKFLEKCHIPLSIPPLSDKSQNTQKGRGCLSYKN